MVHGLAVRSHRKRERQHARAAIDLFSRAGIPRLFNLLGN